MKKISVISADGARTVTAAEGEVLADVLARLGFDVPAACGRRGTCGKCAVKLVDGCFGGEAPDSSGMIRSCKAKVTSDAAVEVNFRGGEGLSSFAGEDEIQTGSRGIAVDIGTTTVAAMLLKEDGTTASASCLNPQSAFGADVISRIDSWSKGRGEELTALVRKCIAGLEKKLSGDEPVEKMTVSGNTTMLHIFSGVSPESMGVSPFTPAFTDSVSFSGSDLGLNAKNVTVLPSVSAFIGGDILAGAYALGLHKADKTVLLADLGTNGELVLAHGGELYCASTAAGPALEGACIECGMGGVVGAIDRVYRENGKLKFTTVGGAKPTGICGAGLTDAIALMLRDGIIDETGYMEEDRFYLCEDVWISQADVRQFQLAKSAVRSGIDTLAEVVGVSLGSVEKLFVAGGLGFYLSAQSAFESGLLPRTAEETFTPAGNTSLKGALLCLGSEENLRELSALSKKCKTVDLGGNPAFSQRFMENMYFD